MKLILVFFVVVVGQEMASTQDPSLVRPLPDTPSILQVVPNYRPITHNERVLWFVRSIIGPRSLLLRGPISAGLSTAQNKPSEYGPHWEGFGKRYGMRLTGVATGNLMQVSLGGARILAIFLPQREVLGREWNM
jgi:hypothetical protein